MSDNSYDRFPSSFVGLGLKLKADYPEVEAVTGLELTDERLKINDDNPNGIKVNVLRADTSVWQMLDIKVLKGNPRKYVEGTSNILISESFKDKFFHNEDPVGKTIYNVPAYYDKPSPRLITGVIKDLPSNSIFRSQVIILQNHVVKS